MGLTYVASLPIPLLCPQLQACIGLPSIALSADLTGALALNASLTVTPPTIALYLAAELEASAQLAASLVAAIPLPSVSLDASISAGFEASLSLSLSLLADFGLGFGLSLSAFLSASIGVYAFTYTGPGNALGTALTSALAATWPDGSPTSGSCSAVVLGAVSPVAQTQIARFLDGLGFGSGLVTVGTMGALADISIVSGKAETQAFATLSAKAAAQAKITANLQARASAGITVPLPAVTLAALAKYRAALTVQAGLAPPKISAALSATANLAAGIQANAGFMADLGLAMGRWDAELFAYSYSGTGAALGGAITTALGTTWGDGSTPTSGECAAVVLAATDTFSAGILAGFFGGV